MELEKIIIDNSVKSETGCWEWKGDCGSTYGRIFLFGKNFVAHRLSYELFVGAILPGHIIHHKCGNKRCVNPDHLDCIKKEQHSGKHRYKGSNCLYGHRLDFSNLRVDDNGNHRCRTCDRNMIRKEVDAAFSKMCEA